MHNVTIYTTPTCGFCHMAKEYFSSKNIGYKEVDVTTGTEGMDFILKNTGQMGVPVIDIDNTIILGFDRPKIDTALAAK